MIKVFVTCPTKTVTGGVELLHQVVSRLNYYDIIDAEIYYLDGGKHRVHPEAYKCYNNPISSSNDVNDADYVIVPEIWAHQTLDLSTRPIIYWESVDNYFKWCPEDLQYYFKKDTIHLAQSYYALDFLNSLEIPKKNIIYVSDYLNEQYLKNKDEDLKVSNRKARVLYNPVKGKYFTNAIMKYIINKNNNIIFTPIQNMTRDEIIDLMKESMLYIDFGDHPGKDRIPREAAMCGCCIITGLDGSAKYKEDVYIDDKYKFEREESNIPDIYSRILYIINNYNNSFNDFYEYRNRIRNEQLEFNKGIDNLVKLLYKEKK